jgi:hypothetical protein
MREPSVEIQALLHELKEDKPYEIELGNKKYKVKYLKDKPAELASYQSLKLSNVAPESVSEAIEIAEKQRGVMAKCVSYLLLNSYLKIKLFHWIHWRYLSWTMSRRALASGIIHTQIALDMEAFSVGTQFLAAMNTLKMKKTREEVELSQVDV